MQKLCFLIIILLFAITGVAAAHPPARIELTYTEQSGELGTTITHNVADPATHFVREVVIRKNGEVYASENFTGQPSPDIFTYRYQIPLSPGDEVTATADCNIGGSVTARLSVMPGQTGSSSRAPGTTPLWVYHAVLMAAGILCIMAAGLMPVWGKRIIGWYRLHIVTAVAGIIFLIPAVILVFRVSYLSVSPEVFAVHIILGLLLIVTLFAALLLAVIRNRSGPRKAAVRKVHLWAGRAFIVLVLINILTGLFSVGVI
ncbi:MAG: hypothetical protein LUQ12_04440 [Methanoregulaceae archaeon]|nr:hypothetical protein [Methanoregulaceae archaeon]